MLKLPAYNAPTLVKSTADHPTATELVPLADVPCVAVASTTLLNVV